ncbi:hypothetical protein HYX04_03200, partial [Candidatus Woesearchaeota archaeon]|nr:hypothetical protein [Candidatus Woesearchaeota archaeon]
MNKRGWKLLVIFFILLASSIFFVNALANNSQITKKNKLNKETESFLKNIKDKEQEKDFIIKFKNTIDKSKLNKVSTIKTIGRLKV